MIIKNKSNNKMKNKNSKINKKQKMQNKMNSYKEKKIICTKLKMKSKNRMNKIMILSFMKDKI